AYIVTYADGRTVEAPLRYGREIRALDDGAADQQLSTHRVAVPESGDTLRGYRWRNPRPNVAIRQIRFHTDSPLACPILFGIAAVRSGSALDQ
ncbi:MAG TPA: hypothetical protein VKT77_01640, partial [Chthonomonadaceae bacterium]|nr:hypothetical protein [Chthonomonadaceae bacterium]